LPESAGQEHVWSGDSRVASHCRSLPFFRARETSHWRSATRVTR